MHVDEMTKLCNQIKDFVSTALGKNMQTAVFSVRLSGVLQKINRAVKYVLA